MGVQNLFSDVGTLVIWLEYDRKVLFDLSCADMDLCAYEEREEVKEGKKGGMRRENGPHFNYYLHSEN